jgi:precorrin-3B C17-methyltransferase
MTGVLNLVSVGPGFADLIIPRAEAAIKSSDVIVAYELYLRWIEPWIESKEIHTPPLTQERERAMIAIAKARDGEKVALISSGDIGVYAMAALAFDEIKEDDNFEINVVPGITSANACASLLGSPLSHDFATLSLSDLLCPWEWIEQCARHIASADLSCVLYNVQSVGRKQGVYRILRVMLEAKTPQTLCGVVRNAYRPGQQVDIYRLDELPDLQFDMLTTIVIGNRFTQRKQDHIFTPRGYNDWVTPTQQKLDQTLPDHAIWVFSGTSDGNDLAQKLVSEGYPIVVSAATTYGAEVVAKKCPDAFVWNGQSGVEARRKVLLDNQAKVLIDATHPYADKMSEQLIDLSHTLGLPYIRYERPSEVDVDAITLCSSTAKAAEHAIKIGQRIFLSTGSKDLAAFLQAPGTNDKQWFLRVTAEPDFIRKALELGIPQSNICAMQGPFSQAFNTALWSDWNIDCVVTKDSGAAGGYRAKADAAKALDIPLLVIQRPQIDYPIVCDSFDAVQQQLSDKYNKQ